MAPTGEKTGDRWRTAHAFFSTFLARWFPNLLGRDQPRLEHRCAAVTIPAPSSLPPATDNT